MVEPSRLPLMKLAIPKEVRDAEGAVTIVGTQKIHIVVPAGVPSLDPSNVDRSLEGTRSFDLRKVVDQDRDNPLVVSIQRLRPGSQTVVAAFQEAAVTGEFNVRVVITEEPKSLDLKK